MHQIVSYFQKSWEELVKESHDSGSIFADRKIVDPKAYAAHPNSPTAQLYLQAFVNLFEGSDIIRRFPKDTVENDNDCDCLQPAFERIALGHISENSLFEPCKPPKKTFDLAEQYLRIRHKDESAEYVKILLIIRKHAKISESLQLSEYEFSKLFIRTLEEFAHQLQSRLEADKSPMNKKILIDVHYLLCSRYVSTHQLERASDSLQRCYDLDPSNYSALYGVAYTLMSLDPNKAINLFLEFVKKAPVCDKQFPNAYYMLAELHIHHIQKAFKYCALAEKAEEKRLPFLPPVDVLAKDMMQVLKTSRAMQRIVLK